MLPLTKQSLEIMPLSKPTTKAYKTKITLILHNRILYNPLTRIMLTLPIA